MPYTPPGDPPDPEAAPQRPTSTASWCRSEKSG
jgi:hypothetical protein